MEDRKILETVIGAVYKEFLSRNRYEEMHAEDTLKHVVAVWQNPPIALSIAAYGHDVQRAVSDNKRIKTRMLNQGSYREYKDAHAEISHNLIKALMYNINVDRKLIDDVGYLVRNHEFGVTEPAPLIDSYTRSYCINSALQILISADARAFFEEHSLKKYLDDYGIEGLAKGEGGLRSKVILNYGRMDTQLREEVLGLKYYDKDLERIIRDILIPQRQS